ncbi:MAG: hypothetical protein AB1546_10870, partial [bacterium]
MKKNLSIPHQNLKQASLLCTSILLCLFFLTQKPTLAGHPLSTEDAWTIDVNHYEFETGYNQLHLRDQTREKGIYTSLSYGLLQNLYINLTINCGLEPENNCDPAEFNAKRSFKTSEKNTFAVSGYASSDPTKNFTLI